MILITLPNGNMKSTRKAHSQPHTSRQSYGYPFSSVGTNGRSRGRLQAINALVKWIKFQLYVKIASLPEMWIRWKSASPFLQWPPWSPVRKRAVGGPSSLTSTDSVWNEWSKPPLLWRIPEYKLPLSRRTIFKLKRIPVDWQRIDL